MKVLRCKACSKEVNKGDTSCPDCGCTEYVECIMVVQFEHPGVKYPFSAHKTMVLGRDHFRLYGEKNYRMVSKKQFEVISADEGWKIRGLEENHPTLLNNKDITHQTVKLNDGDIIKVSTFELKVRIVEKRA